MEQGAMSTVESHNGVYKGEWVDGEKHGRGTFQWTGGNGVRYDDNAAGGQVARRYEGEYVRGRKHGHGILFSGGARYDGQCHDAWCMQDDDSAAPHAHH